MSPEQLLSQAKSLQQAGRLQEATVAFEKLRGLFPKFPPILNDLAVLYLQQGRFNEGRQLLQKSLQLDPKQPMTIYNLGKTFQNQGQFNDASKAFAQVTNIQPAFVDAYFSRGICLHHLEQFDEAVKSFDTVLNLHPDAVHVHNAKGVSLYHAGHYNNALTALQKALTLNQQAPEIYNNLGLVFHKLNQFEVAVEHFNQALKINPQYADAYSNRGLSRQALRLTDEALADYDQCISIDSNHADAHWNKALIHIQLGNFEEGWKLYEWRWKSFSKRWARNYKEPLWLGQFPLKNKTILIYPEQGYGDFIQFCRYIPLLKEQGAAVILEVPGPLVNLASGLSEDMAVIETGKKTPSFDYQCPIMSLPLAFKTTLDNIPSSFPYLKVDPEKLKFWREKLGTKTKPRIGLVWSGSTHHKNDHNRSLELEALLPLLELPFEFHSLQKEIREQDEAILNNSGIQNHQLDLKDFADTAGLIDLMDVVISVDTAVAHLTGALGKRLFLLLPNNPDYRWMLGRTDSSWYPSAKILRQTNLNDWVGVIDRLKTTLSAKVGLT